MPQGDRQSALPHPVVATTTTTTHTTNNKCEQTCKCEKEAVLPALITHQPVEGSHNVGAGGGFIMFIIIQQDPAGTMALYQRAAL